MSVTELSMSRYYRDVAFLRGLYVHPRLRNRATRWRLKRERVRERRMQSPRTLHAVSAQTTGNKQSPRLTYSPA